VISGLLPIDRAGTAIAKGTDVYLFLTGMMLLSELARREGVFDWLAERAIASARGSRARLFALIYLVGIGVTVFLSNDATAVVLTPAVYAAVQRAKTKALPYLLICAFIANAASFVLPISNPANLVVYGSNLPPLIQWLRTFLLPSLLSIGATWLVLRWLVRQELEGGLDDASVAVPLTREGRFAAFGILATGAILIAASALGRNLGLPTCIAAWIAVLSATAANRRALAAIVKGVSWSVLPLVAGLFVLVEALNHVGALQDVSAVLHWISALPQIPAALTASFGIAGLSNVMNNLPAGLLAGGALRSGGATIPAHVRDAILIGVDLGPNLSVTGSLATVLWLIALRREGEHIGAWQFLKIGVLTMPPALALATLAAALLSN
jgi:arsenical pump membrane protein